MKRLICRLFDHEWGDLKYNDLGAFDRRSGNPYDCICDRCGLRWEHTPYGARVLARQIAQMEREALERVLLYVENATSDQQERFEEHGYRVTEGTRCVGVLQTLIQDRKV